MELITYQWSTREMIDVERVHLQLKINTVCMFSARRKNQTPLQMTNITTNPSALISDLPPLNESLDEGRVALACSKVQQGHAPEGLGVNQVFGFGPAGPVHHLLTNNHHATLKGAARLTRETLLKNN